MALLTVFFCCGIAINKYFFIPVWPLSAICALLAFFALIFLRHKFSSIIIILLIMALGSLFFISRRILPNNHIAKITPYGSQRAVLTGSVSSYPQSQAHYTSFIMEAQQLVLADKDYAVKGRVLVKIFREENIVYGQKLKLKGRISRPYIFAGSKYYREYLKRRGIYTVFAVSKASGVEYLGQAKGNTFQALAFKLRGRANSELFGHIPFTQAALLSAMILGDRSSIPAYLNKMFVQTGTVHMLAISGFNVGIVAVILELALKSFRIKRKARYILLLFVLLFYCVLTGACAPVVRSTIMAAVLLTAYFFKREVGVLHSLGLAAMIILAINPAQLFDIGFQLSFVSIL
ncbi:MAG: ComEC/Rec2 family competence protein, partial [Candidatus Omnitrophota bacterium]